MADAYSFRVRAPHPGAGSPKLEMSGDDLIISYPAPHRVLAQDAALPRMKPRGQDRHLASDRDEANKDDVERLQQLIEGISNPDDKNAAHQTLLDILDQTATSGQPRHVGSDDDMPDDDDGNGGNGKLERVWNFLCAKLPREEAELLFSHITDAIGNSGNRGNGNGDRRAARDQVEPNVQPAMDRRRYFGATPAIRQRMATDASLSRRLGIDVSRQRSDRG